MLNWLDVVGCGTAQWAPDVMYFFNSYFVFIAKVCATFRQHRLVECSPGSLLSLINDGYPNDVVFREAGDVWGYFRAKEGKASLFAHVCVSSVLRQCDGSCSYGCCSGRGDTMFRMPILMPYTELQQAPVPFPAEGEGATQGQQIGRSSQ